MKDICCIGHITRDKIITPENEFYQAGGTALYMAYGFANLPHDVSFGLITKTGTESADVISKMRADGIDVVNFDSHSTVYFENKYGVNSNNRSQRVLAKADPFTIDELADANAGIFHLGTLLSDDFSPECVEHLAQRGRISIDVQGYLREVRGERVVSTTWADMHRVLAVTSILKLNEKEKEAISNFTDPRDVARELAALGVEEVVLTLGSEGSLIYAHREFYDIPAYKPAKLVDATGCGDTYSTGYLYARMRGAGYAEAGRFAAAMCTLKLEHCGPFDRTVDDINAILA